MRVAFIMAMGVLLAGLNVSLARAQSITGLYEKIFVMPGPVIKGHAELEKKCTNCHPKSDYKSAPNKLCAGCHDHKTVALDIEQRRGFHGRNPAIRNATCISCHTDHKGRTADIIGLDRETFDHNQTDFALNGAHRAVQCQGCHAPNEKFRKAEIECAGCHGTIDLASLTPKDRANPRKNRQGRTSDPHKGRLKNCTSCHKETSWKDLKPFDHAEVSRSSLSGSFVLVGKHAKADCATCHAGDQFRNIARTCVSCHKLEDKHKGVFGTRCDICHSQKDWKQNIVSGANDGSLASAIKVLKKANFDHSKTKFPLVGNHKSKAKCEDCHAKTFKIADRSCFACHKKDDKHKGLFGKTCETCHTPHGFKKLLASLGRRGSLANAIRILKKANFDHDKTKFALVGNHKTKAKCENCHIDSFKKTPQNCYACHAKQDEHKGRFGKQCEACHTPIGWKTFGGVTLTSGSLRNAIRVLKKANFKHKKTRFSSREGRRRGELHGPLTGRHRRANCRDCHKKTFKDTPRDCYSCHAREGRNEHGRKAANKYRNCGRCHGFGGW